MSLWRGCHSAASARGAVWWGDVLFLVTSLAYVLMDFLPPVPHFPAVLLALALAVLASAACYAFAWRGAAPSATEAVAEVLNVGASLVYLVATVLAVAVRGADGAAAIYALQVVATLCFLLDSLAYAAAWRAAAAGLAPRDASLWAAALYVVAAALYVGAASVPFFDLVDGGLAAATGALPRLHPSAVGVLHAGDCVYLTCALACCLATAQAAEEEEAAAVEGEAVDVPASPLRAQQQQQQPLGNRLAAVPQSPPPGILSRPARAIAWPPLAASQSAWRALMTGWQSRAAAAPRPASGGASWRTQASPARRASARSEATEGPALATAGAAGRGSV